MEERHHGKCRKSYRNHRSSKKGFEDAIEAGIERANKTLKNVSGAWVKDMKVEVKDGKIRGYRVNMKVTFVLTD